MNLLHQFQEIVTVLFAENLFESFLTRTINKFESFDLIKKLNYLLENYLPQRHKDTK